MKNVETVNLAHVAYLMVENAFREVNIAITDARIGLNLVTDFVENKPKSGYEDLSDTYSEVIKELEDTRKKLKDARDALMEAQRKRVLDLLRHID